MLGFSRSSGRVLLLRTPCLVSEKYGATTCDADPLLDPLGIQNVDKQLSLNKTFRRGDSERSHAILLPKDSLRDDYLFNPFFCIDLLLRTHGSPFSMVRDLVCRPLFLRARRSCEKTVDFQIKNFFGPVS